MSLIKKLKDYKYEKKKPQNKKLEYLSTSNLKAIVGLGLSEWYKIKPKNPVTFLAEWLKNESQSKEILNKIESQKQLKESWIQQAEEMERKNEEMLLEKRKLEEEIQSKKDDLEKTIETCEDFEDNWNDICEKIKNVMSATGVYISKYDVKRVFPIDPSADETGHLDPEGVKVLQYLHWCNDHSFLHRKILEPDSGVTYRLISPKEEDEEGGENKEEENNNEEEGEEGEEKKGKVQKEEVLKTVLINEVVNDPNIKFFREPRLGCYLAFDIRYMSSMQYSSLISAIENLNKYNIKFAEQEKHRLEREEWEKEEAAEKEQAEKDNEGDEESEKNEEGNKEEQGDEEEKEDNKPAVLEEFTKEEKVFILSIDTLGQDRVFTEEERVYLMKIAKLIKNSMMNHEIKLLEKDRDLRIDYLNIESPFKDEYDSDRIANEQDLAVKEYSESDTFLNKGITDDAEKSIEFDMIKARTYVNIINNTDLKKCLDMFEKFEFVEYEKIFQNWFYFGKFEGEDINEVDTHKLSWKKSRKMWVNAFDIMKEYDPIGAKPEEIKTEFKGNVILANLEAFVEKEEEITEYSFVLMQLVNYVIDILKVRKSDIIRRYNVKKGMERERNGIIKKNEEIEENRKLALEEAKEEFDKEHEAENEEEEEEENDEENAEKKEEEDGEGAGNADGEGEGAGNADGEGEGNGNAEGGDEENAEGEQDEAVKENADEKGNEENKQQDGEEGEEEAQDGEENKEDGNEETPDNKEKDKQVEDGGENQDGEEGNNAEGTDENKEDQNEAANEENPDNNEEQKDEQGNENDVQEDKLQEDEEPKPEGDENKEEGEEEGSKKRRKKKRNQSRYSTRLVSLKNTMKSTLK